MSTKHTGEERRRYAVDVIVALIGVCVVTILLTHWVLSEADNAVLQPMTVEQMVQMKAIEARQEDADYHQAYDEMESACGKGNVYEGSGYGAGRVFGCLDYKKVDIKELQ